MFDNLYTGFIVNATNPPDQERQLPPATFVDLATANGARAQRLGDKIGTLEAGKRADIITIDLNRNYSLYPLNKGNLFYWLVSQGAGTEVEESMVDGTFLLRDGEFTTLDEEAIMARSDEWMGKFTDWYLDRKAAGEPVTVRKYPDYDRR